MQESFFRCKKIRKKTHITIHTPKVLVKDNSERFRPQTQSENSCRSQLEKKMIALSQDPPKNTNVMKKNLSLKGNIKDIEAFTILDFGKNSGFKKPPCFSPIKNSHKSRKKYLSSRGFQGFHSGIINTRKKNSKLELSEMSLFPQSSDNKFNSYKKKSYRASDESSLFYYGNNKNSIAEAKFQQDYLKRLVYPGIIKKNRVEDLYYKIKNMKSLKLSSVSKKNLENLNSLQT